MMKHSLLDGTVRRAFTALCWNVATPVAYKAVLALARNDWVHLTTIKVAASRYTCVRTLSGDLQIAAFFKKYPEFNLGIDLEEKAIMSFWSSERQCYKANERLAALGHDLLSHGPDVASVIRKLRKKVALVLGRCPTPAQLEPAFGPGSTFDDVGPFITVPDKMSNSYTLTRGARLFMHAWDDTAWSRYAAAGLEIMPDRDLIGLDPVAYSQDVPLYVNSFDCSFSPRGEELVRGNRFTTVPKDAWKLRGICIEPSINLFYQLGIGAWISRRMGKRLGWFKSRQQEHHKLLARLGSLTGLSATIDLSNASDTLCFELVKLLLPSSWFDLLNACRSPFTQVDGRWVKLEKFSSMGNGYTFELETLLFRVIAEVACEGSLHTDFQSDTISTFGDDIICPSDKALNVVALLEFLGFSINLDKTFLKGKFRESCGGDYYGGKDVRPHYLKESINEPHQYIALANGLRRFGIRHILCGGPDVHRIPWLRLLDSLPSQIRACRGPEALGDLVIHDVEETWRTTVRESRRYFRVWRPVLFGRTGWDHFRPGVVLASALYGCGDGRPTRSISQLTSYPTQSRVIEAGGVLTRVNGQYISGYRFGRVSYS